MTGEGSGDMAEKRDEDIQLHIRISLLGRIERNGKVIRAEGGVEDGRTPGAVVGYGLVDHVPRVALALVVAHDVADVRLDDGLQRGARPGAAGYCLSSVSIPFVSTSNSSTFLFPSSTSSTSTS